MTVAANLLSNGDLDVSVDTSAPGEIGNLANALQVFKQNAIEKSRLEAKQEEVGVQRVCFFTKTDSPWNYSDVDSLKGMSIGAFKDGYYSEVTDYMAQNEEQFQYIQGNRNYVTKSLKKNRCRSPGRVSIYTQYHGA